jgi:hypothetical protein
MGKVSEGRIKGSVCRTVIELCCLITVSRLRGITGKRRIASCICEVLAAPTVARSLPSRRVPNCATWLLRTTCRALLPPSTGLDRGREAYRVLKILRELKVDSIGPNLHLREDGERLRLQP